MVFVLTCGGDSTSINQEKSHFADHFCGVLRAGHALLLHSLDSSLATWCAFGDHRRNWVYYFDRYHEAIAPKQLTLLSTERPISRTHNMKFPISCQKLINPMRSLSSRNPMRSRFPLKSGYCFDFSEYSRFQVLHLCLCVSAITIWFPYNVLP